MARHSETLFDIYFDNLKLADPSPGSLSVSAWERAVKKLAPVMNIDEDIAQQMFENISEPMLKECTDDFLIERIKHGNVNGIPVQYIVESWQNELAMYLSAQGGEVCPNPYFPMYGEPRPLAFL